MTVNWKPIRDKLVVKIIKLEEHTSGGIYLPNLEKENMAREEGIILSLGRDVFTDSLDPDLTKEDAKIGSTIAFARYGGKTLGKDEDGNEIRVMRDIDVLAVKEEV